MGSVEGSLNQMTRSSGWPGPGARVSQGSRAFLPSSPDTLVTGTMGGEAEGGEAEGEAGAEDEAGSRSRRVLSRPRPSMGTTSMMEEVANTGPAIDRVRYEGIAKTIVGFVLFGYMREGGDLGMKYL